MTKAPEYKQPATAATAAPETAKMLIFLPNGKPRLLTITLPKESCTLSLAAVLEEHNIPFEENTYVQCMQNIGGAIDYYVSVGSSMKIEDMLRNHPVFRRRADRKNKSQSTKNTPTEK